MSRPVDADAAKDDNGVAIPNGHSLKALRTINELDAAVEEPQQRHGGAVVALDISLDVVDGFCRPGLAMPP